MKTNYIPKIITLFACAVVCIISVIRKTDVTYSLEVLLGTLVVFYIIGLIAKVIIEKTIASDHVIKKPTEDDEETLDENTTEGHSKEDSIEKTEEI